MIQTEHSEDRILLPRVAPRGELYEILLVINHRELELDIKTLVGLEGLEVLRNNHQDLLCLDAEWIRNELCLDVVVRAIVHTLSGEGGQVIYLDDATREESRYAQMKLVSMNEDTAEYAGCVGVVMKK